MSNELIYFTIPVRVGPKGLGPEFDFDVAAKMLAEHACGTVFPVLNASCTRDEIEKASAHVHESTRDYACEPCTYQSRDGEH